MAKHLVQLGRELDLPEDCRQQAKAALTELFLTVKNDKTPITVKRVVNDIDEQEVSIIRRFTNAFKAITGNRKSVKNCVHCCGLNMRLRIVMFTKRPVNMWSSIIRMWW